MSFQYQLYIYSLDDYFCLFIYVLAIFILYIAYICAARIRIRSILIRRITLCFGFDGNTATTLVQTLPQTNCYGTVNIHNMHVNTSKTTEKSERKKIKTYMATSERQASSWLCPRSQLGPKSNGKCRKFTENSSQAPHHTRWGEQCERQIFATILPPTEKRNARQQIQIDRKCAVMCVVHVIMWTKQTK